MFLIKIFDNYILYSDIEIREKALLGQRKLVNVLQCHYITIVRKLFVILLVLKVLNSK